MMNAKVEELLKNIGFVAAKIQESDVPEKLSIMWDVGDILISAGITDIELAQIQPRDNSYSSINLLIFCSWIRNEYSNKILVIKQFNKIPWELIFNIVLPLVNNPKYLINREIVNQLLTLIRDGEIIKAKQIVAIINDSNMPGHGFGIPAIETYNKNNILSDMYKELACLIKENKIDVLNKLKKEIGENRLLQISQTLMAIVNDNYQGPSNINISSLPMPIAQLVIVILPISLENNKTKESIRSQFDLQKLLILADIFNSLRTGEPILNLRERLRL